MESEERCSRERRELRSAFVVVVCLMALALANVLFRWGSGESWLEHNTLLFWFTPVFVLGLLGQALSLRWRERRSRHVEQTLRRANVDLSQHAPLSTWGKVRYGLRQSAGFILMAVSFPLVWWLVAPFVGGSLTFGLGWVGLPMSLVAVSVLAQMTRLEEGEVTLEVLEQTYREAVRDRAELSGSLSLDANLSSGGLEMRSRGASGEDVILDHDAQQHVEPVFVERSTRKGS